MSDVTPAPSLEERRFVFDQRKAADDAAREAQRARSDRLTSYWTRISIILPLLGAIVGYFMQSAAARKTAAIKLVDRQLSELYYPVQLRLRKDDKLFDFWQNYKGGDDKLFKEVEFNSILKNDLEIVAILDKHFDLLRNPDEALEMNQLTGSIIEYERHVAIFSALHAVQDNRTPWEVNHDWGYPKEFETRIDQRVQELESQRRALSKKWF